MDWKWLLQAIFFLTLLKSITCKEIIAQVNPKRLVQYVPERFLSMTIDPGTILIAGNLGNEALNMARSLSPSFVRLGGKSTNYIQFGKELLMENTTITEEQWDSVYKFVSKAGLDLIASLNPSNRMNGVWDSRDALQLISYSDKQGYNLAWQLGYDTEGVSASGAEIGRDIVRLRKILDGFSKFAHAPLFGPDLQEIDTTKDSFFVHDLLYQAGPVLGAIFLQPKFKAEEDPGQSIMDAIVSLDSQVWGRALRLGRILPRKPIWIAEREVSQGTPDDAIQLIKRLGSAARIGVQVVMRQVGPEALTQPTPEFWVALIYKNLVGRGVLDARISSGNRSEIPIFSHCAQALPSDRSIIDAGLAYDKGAVTVFGVNESPDDVKISLRVGMKEEKVHLYSLTFSDNAKGKMEETYMNGQPLTLSPSGDLPILSPQVIKRPSRTGIVVPGKSVFFMVLPDVKSRMCTSMPLVHAGDVKDLSKKLIQVAADVLEKPHARRATEDEDINKNKIYVKFGKQSNSLSSTPEQADVIQSSIDDKNLLSELEGTVSSSIVNDKTAVPEDESKTTSPSIIDSTSIPMDNCTADASETVVPSSDLGEKSRRKRSVDDSPVVDMEFSSSNNGQESQEELVKQFNSYAQKIYESSRSPKSGGDIQISNIPEEIFNTLKKVKVTFKNLGTTSRPEKLIQEVTEKPETQDNDNNYENSRNRPKSEDNGILENAEAEQGLDDIKQPNVYNEEIQEDIQRVPKQADYSEDRSISDDGKDAPGTGENTFRDSQSNNDGPESEREKTGEENEPRSEVELTAIPSRVDQDEARQRLPRDDTLRQGESPLEPSTDEGSFADESARNTELGSENEATDESAKDEGDSQQTKPPVSANSLPDVGTPDPSESASGDDKDTAEEKENLEQSKTETTTQSQSLSSEINDKADQKKLLTTTEMSDFIMSVEGIEPKKIDELMLKMAKTEVNSSEIPNKAENNIKSSTLEKPSNKKEANEAYDGKMSSVESKVTESKSKSSGSDPATVNSQSPDELTEEGESNQLEKSEAIKEEEFLQNGPEIPAVNSPDTVKVVREVPLEEEREAEEESDTTEKPLSLVLVPSMNLLDRPEGNDGEPKETAYESKPVPEDKKGDIDDANSLKEQDSSLIEDRVTDSQEDLAQSPVEIADEKDDDDTGVKQLRVASFRNAPLDNSNDKSYTPKPGTSSEKTGDSEVEDLIEGGNKDVEETETLGEQESEGSRSITEEDQSSQIKSSRITQDSQARSVDEVPEIQQTMVTVPFQQLIVPFASPIATEPSSLATRSDDKVVQEETETEKEETETEKEETEVESVQNEKKDDETKKASTEKEQRRLKLLAIRNQIMEARERFKAAAREEGWRAALQRREEEMRNLLHQERDKRKFIALPVGGPDRTLLSRPRRLTYDPVSGEASKEEMYDYGPERAYNKMLDVYGLPLINDFNKPYLSDQGMPLAYNNPEQNHVIFPLDPKAPQAVVFNNRIIPAKLYGVISVNDEASKLAGGPQKQVLDLPNEPLYSKYIKPYDAPPLKEKYEPQISEVPSLNPIDNYKTIPRDSRIKRLDNHPNFIPVIVLSNTLRRKRALPEVQIKKVKAEQIKLADIKQNKTVRMKRSLSQDAESFNYLNEIPKERLKSHVASNEIKPESFGAPSGMVFFEYPQEIDNGILWNSGKLGQARTIGGLAPLPPLPPPLPLLPPLHPVFPEPFPPQEKHLFEPLQEKHLPEPLEEKTRPDPPQAILLTMLQDKFKSLLGMIEGLADWCGVNK